MKYRKKPVVIEAMQWPGIMVASVSASLKFEDWIESVAPDLSERLMYRGGNLIIPTLEGDMSAEPGDWIIRGVKGELYPCKPDIFEQTYEAVS